MIGPDYFRPKVDAPAAFRYEPKAASDLANTEWWKQFGDPVTVTVEPDGSRTLDYPRQPEGWTNYVIQIGADGKMSSLRQLLNPDNFAKVKPGLGQQDVRNLLGRPAKTTPYALKNEEVWDWRFKHNGQESKLFSVTFDSSGKVVSTATADDPRETMSGTR
jgi:hypothetical protein